MLDADNGILEARVAAEVWSQRVINHRRSFFKPVWRRSKLFASARSNALTAEQGALPHLAIQ
jgi:hypothetical protein